MRNENYELKNSIQTLNKNLTSLKNENDDLKLKVKNFENGTLQGVNWGLPSSPPPKSKRFVQVTFKNFGNGKTYDYLLGNHRNIKVGDFVMVPTHGTIKPAKVVRISEQGEISEHANSEIIKKL